MRPAPGAACCRRRACAARSCSRSWPCSCWRAPCWPPPRACATRCSSSSGSRAPPSSVARMLPTPPPERPLELGERTTLDAAAGQLPFEPLVPSALGEPDGVYLRGDERAVARLPGPARPAAHGDHAARAARDRVPRRPAPGPPRQDRGRGHGDRAAARGRRARDLARGSAALLLLPRRRRRRARASCAWPRTCCCSSAARCWFAWRGRSVASGRWRSPVRCASGPCPRPGAAAGSRTRARGTPARLRSPPRRSCPPGRARR